MLRQQAAFGGSFVLYSREDARHHRHSPEKANIKARQVALCAQSIVVVQVQDDARMSRLRPAHVCLLFSSFFSPVIGIVELMERVESIAGPGSLGLASPRDGKGKIGRPGGSRCHRALPNALASWYSSVYGECVVIMRTAVYTRCSSVVGLSVLARVPTAGCNCTPLHCAALHR